MAMRPRKPNWSTEQKLLLVQLVKTRREDVLTGRHSCRELATTRRWAWDEIAEEISTAYPDVPRTGKECERHWFVELAKAKEAMVTHKSLSGKELAELINPVTKLVIEILKLQRKEAELKGRLEEESTTFQEEEEEQVEVKYLLAPVAPVTRTELPDNHMSNNSQDTAPVSPPCSTSPSAEKRDLELSVLRRQERVLQLQEEYYSLKIKHLKARMLMDL
ncbi:uncharacterized protein si:dkey-6e2.2 isoform X1 [Electrophorus electricus]|uniref:uncharacterized protein si:dkey-6e2.2 isoform X1 n=1 Tax=Electrophorus electricus TaxID=8005 RepID=UPI0015D0B651|nr:uncharacterized protein si:dkey-6e2.2 isoform X1 [Electrophorus electricus]XP_026882096.2 uncharacterized protein si:dkey-6e2.2 isoform X1 [Electrophorus electricus]XP_026882098.2 uncharacterized protein si:dkey-6e2.2 isoform X1 [Electrophorus electricus]XP_035380093.1 uncharacterized protein si:dkey-6e2.2 isoform X1 [Electrophorus electricus]XP_035380094.1 uncharacterized protein si:dkey-6e2.2 isoform X1 [Electrophorus electricus]XP_035380095.1 uncharacterized protein si:dkey-6e2.2 isoform